MKKFYTILLFYAVFSMSLLNAVIISAATTKDKAYHTCRYEVKKLLDQLEEFDGVYAKVTYAKLKKQNGVYGVSCRFSRLTGRRGVMTFPIRRVNFKYSDRAFDFIMDGIRAAEWPVHIGIFHR